MRFYLTFCPHCNYLLGLCSEDKDNEDGWLREEYAFCYRFHSHEHTWNDTEGYVNKIYVPNMRSLQRKGEILPIVGEGQN